LKKKMVLIETALSFQFIRGRPLGTYAPDDALTTTRFDFPIAMGLVAAPLMVVGGVAVGLIHWRLIGVFPDSHGSDE